MRKLLVISLLLAGTIASAQGIVVPQHLLDSIANPPIERLECLKFDKETVDLGEIREDAEPVQAVFTLTNEGEKPVSILRISTSCGCTTALHEKSSIAAGASTQIRLFYNPKSQSGKQTRKAYIYTDASPAHPSAALSLKVKVLPGELPQGFPVLMGSLALSRKDVCFRFAPGEEKAVERIVCRNIGRKELRLRALDGFCPTWLKFRTEPQVILPGAEAEIILAANAQELPSEARTGFALVVINGLGGKPSERTLNVNYELSTRQ